MTTHQFHPSAVARILFYEKNSAMLWLLVRLYLGYEWLMAGYEKLLNPAWFGADAGAALTGFVERALTKAAGAHPDVTFWYASFLKSVVLPQVTVWSNLITLGELAVGLGLILGLFTGVAAFFGGFMNLNFLLAGTVSTNPQLLVLAWLTVLARRVAGYIGLDRYRKNLTRLFTR
jgi:thiosulfate dehydrogenase (quinone) large subunit